jgi:class 3 adenylate cyclase
VVNPFRVGRARVDGRRWIISDEHTPGVFRERLSAEGVRRSEGLLVQIRVGLNSGEVVVRAIGSDLHMDYKAVGQTTHLAAPAGRWP